MKKIVKSKVVTELVRFVNINIIKPVSHSDITDFEYSLVFVVPKNETKTIKKLNDSFDKVIRLNSKFWENKFDNDTIEFLKDGDKLSNNEYFKNTYYLKLSSRVKPELVDKDINRILDLNELYDGCYGRVSMTLYPFKIEEVFGITCELNNIQKLKEGEKLRNDSINHKNEI